MHCWTWGTTAIGLYAGSVCLAVTTFVAILDNEILHLLHLLGAKVVRSFHSAAITEPPTEN